MDTRTFIGYRQNVVVPVAIPTCGRIRIIADSQTAVLRVGLGDIFMAFGTTEWVYPAAVG